MMQQLKVEDLEKRRTRFDTLCRNVFSTHEGQELMKMLESMFCDIPMYQETDRLTVYAVAQRDLVLEIKSHVKEAPHAVD